MGPLAHRSFGTSLQCTSKQSGYNYNFILNSTGINQFVRLSELSRTRAKDADAQHAKQPTTFDEAVLFGTTGEDGISILTSGMTSLLWFQVIGPSPILPAHHTLQSSPPTPSSHLSTAAVIAVLTVLSFVLPPSYLGSPTSRLFAFQKSGIATILLAILTFVMAFIAFIIDLIVIIPAKNRLDAIEGITASWVSRTSELARARGRDGLRRADDGGAGKEASRERESRQEKEAR